jgi:hypothetical protein
VSTLLKRKYLNVGFLTDEDSALPNSKMLQSETTSSVSDESYVDPDGTYPFH